ncbi:MAG TPA: hypothetical protein VJT32_08070 [bacterium]|nr:hypothetical protein [bacterium]
MNHDEPITYCVRRITSGGRETFIARRLETLEQAAETALRLTVLREQELGGSDEFCAEPE